MSCHSYSPWGSSIGITNYRPVSLTSVVCQQKERVIVGYLRQVWNTSKWLYERQHGFRPGYSCASQIVTVCKDTADSPDEGARTDAIVIDFSRAFDIVPYDRLLMRIVASGVAARAVVWVREFLFGCSQSQSWRTII
jgi:hypothetical protein